MKSRIQELIDQASTMSWEVDHAVTTVDAYALAELIVRMCAQFVEDEFDFLGEEILVKEKMLEHFGVKE